MQIDLSKNKDSSGDFEEATFGIDPDVTKFDIKGQRRSYGEATGFEDLATTLNGKLLGSTRGKADWDWNRHAVKFKLAVV